MRSDYALNLSGLPKELKVLLNILKVNQKDDFFIDENLFDELNWDLFIELAIHHRIYPVIYTFLKEMTEISIPDHVIHLLNQMYQKNALNMLKLAAEIDELSKLCYTNQIKALFIKGPLLAIDLYGNMSLRTSGDIDILVPIEQLEKMENLLLQRGFEKDDYIVSILNDWKWRHHHVTFYHLQKGIKVEVHWRLSPGPGKEPSFNELWERKRTFQLDTTPIFILGKEDLFLFLILHGARHGWSRLRWLVDIKQITRQLLNWEKVINLSRQYQCLHITGQAAILDTKLLGASFPEKLALMINRKRSENLAQDTMFYIKKMVNLHTEPVPKYVADYHKRYLFSLMPFKQKLLFVLSFLFPYPEDAKILPLPKLLHFLYFPLRPFLWLWRKTMKVIPEGAKR